MKSNLYKSLSILHLIYGWLLIVLISIFLIRDMLRANMIPLHQNFIFRLLDPIQYSFQVMTSGKIYWLILFGFFNLYVSKLLKEKNIYSLYISFALIFSTLGSIIYFR